MSSQTAHEVEVVELTEDESGALFDRVARRHMGISGAEFLQRWDSGEWNNINLDDVDGLVEVWAFLPAVR